MENSDQIYGFIANNHLKLLIISENLDNQSIFPARITNKIISIPTIKYDDLLQIARVLHVYPIDKNSYEISNMICNQLIEIGHLLINGTINELYEQINSPNFKK